MFDLLMILFCVDPAPRLFLEQVAVLEDDSSKVEHELK
jgi:hypothetical protein